DLFWDAGDGVAGKTLKVGAREVSARAWEPYGWVVAGRVGKQVAVAGAENETALGERLRQQPLLLSPDVQFKPAKRYPAYFDFYDLKAFKLYTHAMSSVHGEGLASHWPFAKKFGLGGLAFQDLGVWTQCPAPGVLTFCSTEYELREAERQGGMVVAGITGGGEVPLWIHNEFPSSMMQPSPTTLLGAWGGAGAAGAHFESWWMPLEQRRAGALAFQRKAMERYAKNPALGGWHIYAGAPGAEIGMHERTGEFWDYSPTGQEGFRAWLRDARQVDLKALGERWYRDGSRFKNWSEVAIPDIQGLFGALDEGGLRLDSNWQWLKAGGADDEPAPLPFSPSRGGEGAGGGAWSPLAMAPAQQQAFLPWGAAFYRVEFDPGDWLKKNAGHTVYLVCADMIRSKRSVGLWLNGKSIGPYKPANADPAPFALRLTEGTKAGGDAGAPSLKTGKNELILRIPCGGNEHQEGKLFGPVFLTATEPKPYPYLGRGANARYADVKEWQMYSNACYHEPVFDEARAVDPERPYVLSGTASGETDFASGLAAHYGASVQHTGREAWYHPWWAGLGYVAGFYGTSEPSATAHGKSLSRMLGWILLDGDSNHNLFWDIEDYIKEEKDNGWFTANQRVLQLFGKYLREKPAIVIFRSARTHRLGSSAPWNWDIGRGELQAAHYDNVYATERELLLGLIQDYPVLFDAGSEFMEEDVVQALTAYIKNGGTYVALHNTGRHTSLEPDSWPISRLTGFKVVQQARHGKLRFEAHLPLFKGWEGKVFEGYGSALDWLGQDHAKDAGVALESVGDGALALARWENGSVAVACRQIGKGRVVVLGSTFWREGRDEAGAWRTRNDMERNFFERLFADLGVARNADASSADVWARKAITKNGLQEWLLAYNSKDTAVTCDVSLRVSAKPAAVWDMVARKPVNVEEAPKGWVKIKDVAFAGQGVRVFGVKRGELAEGLPFWWAEKTKYWKRVAGSGKREAGSGGQPRTPNPEPRTPILCPATVPFDEWRFFADKDGAVGAKAEWLQPDYDDATWQKFAPVPWNLQDENLKDYRGTGLYRARFTPPVDWQGRRVVLGLYSFNTPIVYDEGEFLLNGVQVAAYKARGWSQTYIYDVTDKLKAGPNVLAVRVKGGKEFSGLAGGVWLATERKLEPALDLGGEWQTAGPEFRVTGTAQLPGEAKACFVFRDIEVPAAWTGRSVFLHIETATQWLGSVVINGQPINYNGYLHPFGLRADINLTPHVQAGRRNRIELWPYATIPRTEQPKQTTAGMEVRSIHVGCAVE
ncbi:MAG: beta-galactosidase, partial [Planctomycetota bacterium]